MEERGAKRASRSKLLKEDPGWLGPFNRMVWASPNCLLVVLLVIGSVACVVLRAGHYSANAFLGAAVVEILLSTDNICLFHQIFEHFKVPREVRPGLLFVGTPFMVAVRGVMFFALKEVYNSVRPIMFAIGLFCLYQGCYVIWVTCTGQDEDKDDPATSAVVVWGKWAFGDRLITHYEGSAFWVYVQGAAKLTPMFLCMAVIEVTDVMFCVDGVSTIFMVDHVHVWTLYTGDILAACMMRALYPQLAGTVELFPDLNYSVAVVLMLVGTDMCCGVLGFDFPPGALAGAMGVLFAFGMLSSVLRGTNRDPEDSDGRDPEREDAGDGGGVYGSSAAVGDAGALSP